jgi:GTP-binding protein HflX
VHVIDGSVELPENQVSAVREVLESIDAAAVPELLVVNKIDAADEVSLARLRHLMPTAVFVSARSGAGLDALRDRIAELLPDPAVLVDVLVPFSHGSLVGRVHAEGTVLEQEHTEHGTRLRAKVQPDLAGRLDGFTNLSAHA